MMSPPERWQTDDEWLAEVSGSAQFREAQRIANAFARPSRRDESANESVQPVTPVVHMRAMEPLPAPVRALDVRAESPVRFSVDELFTAEDFGIVAGEDGAMKTTWMLHLAAAIAGGYRAFGRFQTVQGKVLIVSEEDSAEVLRNRLEAMCRGHGWNCETVLGNVDILARGEVRLLDRRWQDHLREIIRRGEYALVLLDPWAEVGGGEENSNTDGSALVKIVRPFTKLSGANVTIIHHLGKPFEGKRLRDRIRGNSALTSASRCTYVIEHDDEAHELAVTCIKLSRGSKIPKFVVRYVIESAPENRAVWTLARFEYASVEDAALDRAESFVMAQLGAGERMNTSQLKAAATGTGVIGQGIARALKVLEMRRLIDFEPGEHGAKRWGIVQRPDSTEQTLLNEFTLPGNSGQGGTAENDLARQPRRLPGNPSAAEFTLPSPVRGKVEPTASEEENQLTPPLRAEPADEADDGEDDDGGGWTREDAEPPW